MAAVQRAHAYRRTGGITQQSRRISTAQPAGCLCGLQIMRLWLGRKRALPQGRVQLAHSHRTRAAGVRCIMPNLVRFCVWKPRVWINRCGEHLSHTAHPHLWQWQQQCLAERLVHQPHAFGPPCLGLRSHRIRASMGCSLQPCRIRSAVPRSRKIRAQALAQAQAGLLLHRRLG